MSNFVRTGPYLVKVSSARYFKTVASLTVIGVLLILFGLAALQQNYWNFMGSMHLSQSQSNGNMVIALMFPPLGAACLFLAWRALRNWLGLIDAENEALFKGN